MGDLDLEELAKAEGTPADPAYDARQAAEVAEGEQQIEARETFRQLALREVAENTALAAQIDALPRDARERVIDGLRWGDLDVSVRPADAVLALIKRSRRPRKPIRAKGGAKRYADMEKARPVQLTLFDEATRKHTNSIALYDLAPKYVWNTPAVDATIVGGKYKYLPTVSREFEHDDKSFVLKITPARLSQEDGTEIDYYPGEREQMVEMALRRMSIQKKRTHLLNGQAGLTFTLSELRRELEEAGHAYSLGQIREALFVMHRANLDIHPAGSDASLSSTIFPVLAIQQQQPDGSEVTFVTWHPLITEAVKSLDFRQLDYQTHVAIESYIARWLHLRLVHQYRQAAVVGASYSIRATTIVRDGGLSHKQFRSALQKIRKALDELRAAKIIMQYTVRREDGPRKAIIDEVYELTPTLAFVDEQKRANYIKRSLPDRAK